MIAVLPLGTMGSETQGVLVTKHTPGTSTFHYKPPPGTAGKGETYPRMCDTRSHARRTDHVHPMQFRAHKQSVFFRGRLQAPRHRGGVVHRCADQGEVDVMLPRLRPTIGNAQKSSRPAPGRLRVVGWLRGPVYRYRLSGRGNRLLDRCHAIMTGTVTCE